jgi:hypothetical protein
VDVYIPQTWNRYNYGVDNPLSIADKNGLWPFYVHENIIDEVFPGMSKQDLQTLKDASWNMDYAPGQQKPSKAYMHGMSDGGGTVFWGGGNQEHDLVQADNYIDEQLQDAQNAQADWIAEGHTGIAPNALTAFGNALHVVTDRTSPAHQGEQPWADKPWWHYTTIGHFLREAWRSSGEIESSDAAARDLFKRTFGHRLDWVFSAAPCARTGATDSQGNSTGWSQCQ